MYRRPPSSGKFARIDGLGDITPLTMGKPRQRPMVKSVDYYMCLIFVVLPVRALVYLSPVALAGLVANQLGLAGHFILPSKVAVPLVVYFGAECLFTLHYLHKKQIAGRLRPNPPSIQSVHANRPNPLNSAMDFFDRMMAHVDDVPTFVQGHFHGVEFARLSRLDIAKWCAFVFYTKSYDDTTAIEKKELDAMVAKLYAQANSPTTKDLSDGATFPFLKPNLDPFEATARPMALYMATIGVNYVVSTWLRWQGFHYYYVTSAIRYWHRPPQSSHGEAPPLVFVHGVGIGLSTYVPLLYTLFEHSTDRHVFLMDLPYISMQWSDDEVPDKDQIVSAISVMLAQQQLSGTSVHWVGHSFGTIVMSWVCQERPDLVHYLTFVDPVVFGMWKHDGIYNLMYKPPSTAIDLFLWYFASQEIGIARSLRRHLLWYESALFPANLPRHPHSKHVLASVFLSEKDCIIDAPAAYAHLQRGVHLPGPSHNGTPRVPIHATMWSGFTHGELMMHRSAHADVMSTLSFHTNTTISTTHERKSDSG